MIRNKKIALFSAIVSSILTITISPIISYKLLNDNNNYNQNFVSNNTKNFKELGNITETKANASWRYNNVSDLKSGINWFGKYTPDKVSSNELMQLIKLDKPLADVKVQIAPITDDHISSGYLEFKVIQTIHKFQNGIPNGSEEVVLQSDQSSDLWSTKEKYPGLFISTKFNFSWRSDSDIEEFIKSSNLTYDTLDINSVIANMVVKDEKHLLPSIEHINLKKEHLTNETNDKKYGTVKITIEFKDTNDSQWESGSIPKDLTRVIRGLKSTNVDEDVDTTMHIQPTTKYTIQDFEIDTSKFSYFNKYLTNNETTIKHLFPSEIASLSSISPNDMNKFLLTGDFFKNNNNDKKFVKLMYYGKEYNDSSFKNTTGLTDDDISKLGFNSIELFPRDDLGSLSILYNYSYFDVYSNSIKQDNYIQELGPKTFKVNPDYKKILEFEWKTNDSLIGVSSSDKLINDINLNKDNKEYLMAISNQFFDGTFDVYKKDRKVEITEIRRDRATSDVKVSLTFDTWNGSMYDENGQKIEGFKTEKVFKLNNSSSDVSGLVWKSQDEVNNGLKKYFSSSSDENWSLSNVSIVDLTNRIFSGEIPLSTFFTVAGDISSYTMLINTDPAIGSLSITVEKDGKTSSNVFIGFNSSKTEITQFNWVPESEIPKKLLIKNVNEITKLDIINEYLNNISTFKEFNLTEDQITLIPNEITDSLVVEVRIDKFNQNINDSNRVFKINLRGFIQSKYENAIHEKKEKNLTLVLSLVIGILVSSILTSVFIFMLVQQIRSKKSMNKINKRRK